MTAAARADHDSIVALTRELVTIPSRGGIDPHEPVLDHIGAWLGSRQLPATLLTDETGAAVGLTSEITAGSGRSRRRYRRSSYR